MMWWRTRLQQEQHAVCNAKQAMMQSLQPAPGNRDGAAPIVGLDASMVAPVAGAVFFVASVFGPVRAARMTLSVAAVMPHLMRLGAEVVQRCRVAGECSARRG